MAKTASSCECGLCLDNFKDPRNLPCGHSFCKDCLQRMMDAAGNIKCPYDSKLYNVPSRNADDLMRNYALASLIETMNSSANQKAVENCAEHIDRGAEFFCGDCVKSICSKCVLSHKAHALFDYDKTRETSTTEILQIQRDAETFRNTIESQQTATRDAVKALVESSNKKVELAVSKIQEIIAVLNSTMQVLRKKASESQKLVTDTLNVSELDSLHQQVTILCRDVSNLRDTKKLELQIGQTKVLAQRLTDCRSKHCESAARWGAAEVLSDDALTKSLQASLQSAIRVKDCLANNQRDYLSLTDMKQALQTLSTADYGETMLKCKHANTPADQLTTSSSQPALQNSMGGYILYNVPPLWATADQVCLHVESECKCFVAIALARKDVERSWLIKFDLQTFEKCKQLIFAGFNKLNQHLKIKAVSV